MNCHDETDEELTVPVVRITTTYPAPEDDEEDYCPDGEATEESTAEWTEDELVREFRGMHPSCSNPTKPDMVWFTTDSVQDYRTGEWTEESLHLSREATPEQVEVWVRAVERYFGGACK